MDNINNNNNNNLIDLRNIIENQEECAICQDQFESEEMDTNNVIDMSKKRTFKDFEFTVEQEDKIIVLKCKHAFHAACIKPWVDQFKQKTSHVKCPLCREDMIDKPAIEIPMNRQHQPHQNNPFQNIERINAIGVGILNPHQPLNNVVLNPQRLNTRHFLNPNRLNDEVDTVFDVRGENINNMFNMGQLHEEMQRMTQTTNNINTLPSLSQQARNVRGGGEELNQRVGNNTVPSISQLIRNITVRSSNNTNVENEVEYDPQFLQDLIRRLPTSGTTSNLNNTNNENTNK